MLESAHAQFDIVPLNTVGVMRKTMIHSINQYYEEVAQITANLFKKYSVSEGSQCEQDSIVLLLFCHTH